MTLVTHSPGTYFIAMWQSRPCNFSSPAKPNVSGSKPYAYEVLVIVYNVYKNTEKTFE